MRTDRLEELENLVMVIYEEEGLTVRARREILGAVDDAINEADGAAGRCIEDYAPPDISPGCGKPLPCPDHPEGA